MKKQTTIPGTMGAVDRRVIGGKVYVAELRNCGKKSCRRCPHGPYWYRLMEDGSRQYVGTKLAHRKKRE